MTRPPRTAPSAASTSTPTSWRSACAPADALPIHAAWTRRLAARLVAHHDEADDLAQDAMAAALTCAARPRSLKGWLAGTVRNLARQHHRTAGRRIARETQSARNEEESSTLEVVERLSVHRHLVECVHALREPYRSTILLRYFDERTPRQIASLQGVPLKTVETRLTRGLAALRDDLTRGAGSRENVMSLLAAFARSPARPRLGRLIPATPLLGVGLGAAIAIGWSIGSGGGSAVDPAAPTTCRAADPTTTDGVAALDPPCRPDAPADDALVATAPAPPFQTDEPSSRPATR